MKLFLTAGEKKKLHNKKWIDIERPVYLSAPKNSIIHGIGITHLWDKIDRKWVYGDAEDYIQKMKNVGRRATDYPNNTPNRWSGGNWWECLGHDNDFGPLNTPITNGKKIIVKFIITDIIINELRPKGDYLQIIRNIRIHSI